jgi:anti-sigma factor (TIGR02949 family)
MTEHHPDCEKCEELLQGYLDRDLAPDEVLVAERHLNGCDYCRRRYRFEQTLRRYIKVSASERMPAGLVAKLAQLREQAARPERL